MMSPNTKISQVLLLLTDAQAGSIEARVRILIAEDYQQHVEFTALAAAADLRLRNIRTLYELLTRDIDLE